MQEPLTQIALKMQQKIGDGVFVVSSTAPHLFIREPIETAIDSFLGALHLLHRGGKEHIRDLVSHEEDIIDAGGQVVQALSPVDERHA